MSKLRGLVGFNRNKEFGKLEPEYVEPQTTRRLGTGAKLKSRCRTRKRLRPLALAHDMVHVEAADGRCGLWSVADQFLEELDKARDKLRPWGEITVGEDIDDEVLKEYCSKARGEQRLEFVAEAVEEIGLKTTEDVGRNKLNMLRAEVDSSEERHPAEAVAPLCGPSDQQGLGSAVCEVFPEQEGGYPVVDLSLRVDEELMHESKIIPPFLEGIVPRATATTKTRRESPVRGISAILRVAREYSESAHPLSVTASNSKVDDPSRSSHDIPEEFMIPEKGGPKSHLLIEGRHPLRSSLNPDAPVFEWPRPSVIASVDFAKVAEVDLAVVDVFPVVFTLRDVTGNPKDNKLTNSFGEIRILRKCVDESRRIASSACLEIGLDELRAHANNGIRYKIGSIALEPSISQERAEIQISGWVSDTVFSRGRGTLKKYFCLQIYHR